MSRQDTDQYFETDHLLTDLKGRSVRGGGLTLIAQGCRFLLNLGAVMILARLLVPEDFGLIAMVATLTGFVLLFRDAGLSMATVQRAVINHDQVSTLFWVNIAVSLALVAVTAGLAHGVVWYYGEPRLLAVTYAIAGAFIFGGLAVQHQALLRRQMRFRALAVIEVASVASGVAIALALALAGAGYWALVAQQIGAAATNALLVWIACGWRPSLPVRGCGVRPMLGFGANLMGFNVVNYFARTADNILIGRSLGAVSLGLYAKAYELLMLPIRQINAPLTAVAIPALSRLVEDADAYRAFYRRGILLIVSLGMPIVALSFVSAGNIIAVVLGSQWLESVPIFRALSPAAFVGTFNAASGWVYISLGRTDRQLRLALVLTPLTVAAFVIGLRWGTLGVAVAFSISQLVLRLPGILYCFHGTPLRLRDLGAALWRPACASLLAGAVTLWVDQAIGLEAPPIARLAFDCGIYGFAYLAGWLIQPGGLQALIQMGQLLSAIRR